jgi:hypothetical protein
MQIRVDGRDVGLGMVRIGVEGDHGVADIVFEGLPEMDAPVVTLHWTTGTAGDIVALEQTVQGWRFEITSTLTQYGGAQISAYLQMVSGDQRWHSNAFVLRVNELPGVAATVTPPEPTVIDQLIAMVQQGRQEVADALIELGEGVEAVGQALVEVEGLADQVDEDAQGVEADRDATHGYMERAEAAADEAEAQAVGAAASAGAAEAIYTNLAGLELSVDVENGTLNLFGDMAGSVIDIALNGRTLEVYKV